MPQNSAVESLELTFEGLTEYEMAGFVGSAPTSPLQDIKFGALGRLLNDPLRFPNLSSVHIDFVLRGSTITQELLDRAQEILPFKFVKHSVRTIAVRVPDTGGGLLGLYHAESQEGERG